MTTTAEKVKVQILGLSESDRAELASLLIKSLDESVDKDWEAPWDAELERRGLEIRNGKAIGEPADAVLRELQTKYS